jgi:hypothetical protein
MTSLEKEKNEARKSQRKEEKKREKSAFQPLTTAAAADSVNGVSIKELFFRPNLTSFGQVAEKDLLSRSYSSSSFAAATTAAPFRLEKRPGVSNEFDNVIMVAIVIMCHAQQPTADDPHRKQNIAPLFSSLLFSSKKGVLYL